MLFGRNDPTKNFEWDPSLSFGRLAALLVSNDLSEIALRKDELHVSAVNIIFWESSRHQYSLKVSE